MRRRKKILGVLVYVAFLFLVVELVLQGFYYVTSGGWLFSRGGLPIYTTNEFSGLANKPNLTLQHNTNEFRTTIHTNSAGFRVCSPGEEYEVPAPDATFRAMLMGPSFAFGWAVDCEESFAERLEDALEERQFAAGASVEVINAGVPGLGAAPLLNWYRHVGESYRPDLLIQFIYGSMAVPNKIDLDVQVTDAGFIVTKNYTTGQRLRGYAKKSATLFYLWMVTTRLSSGGDAESQPRSIEGAGRAMDIQGAFELDNPAVIESLGYYDDLRDTLAALDTPVLVVYFPLSYSVHPEDIGRWKHLGVREIEAQAAFDAAFCDHLNERGLECLNVTPDLVRSAAETDDRLYYWLDIHWTPLGNSVVANAVADHLASREAGLPPSAGATP